METDDELKVIDYESLKNEYKLSDKQIAVMDREAQSIMALIVNIFHFNFLNP